MKLDSPRFKACFFSALFLFSFLVYLHCLSPAFHPDDSPETITAGYTLSIQHPPGYPLHSLLGRAACLGLPGSPALRVNLLSAFFAALSLVFTAWLCLLLYPVLHHRETIEPKELDRSGIVLALGASLILASSLTLWFQAGIAKGGIYTLNLFLSLVVLICFALGSFRTSESKKWFCLGFLGLGLGIANHWTSQVVLAPSLFLLFLWPIGPGWGSGLKEKIKQLLPAVLFVAPGISLYLYIPLRTRAGAVLSWGEPFSLSGLWWIITRSQYAGVESTRSFDSFLKLLHWVGADLVQEFYWPGLIILALGWCYFLFKKPFLGSALLVWPLSIVFAVCWKANPPSDSLWIIDPYLVPAYAGLCFGLLGYAIGLKDLRNLSLTKATMAKNYDRLKVNAALKALPLLLACFLFVRHLAFCDHRGNFLGYDYAKNLLLSCPEKSLLFCEGDSNTAGPFFDRFVLNRRQDVALVANVLADYPWYQNLIRQHHPDLKVPEASLGVKSDLAYLVSQNPKYHAVYSNSYSAAWVEESHLLPRGLVFLPQANSGPWTLEQLAKNKIFSSYSLRGVFGADRVEQDAITQRLVAANYLHALAALAQAYADGKHYLQAEKTYLALKELKPDWEAPLLQAGNMAYLQGSLEQAKREWDAALQVNPQSAVGLANIGLYYLQMKDWSKAEEYARKALAIDPNQGNAKQLLERANAGGQRGRVVVQARMVPQAQEWAQKGDNFAQQGRAAEAIEAYSRAEKLGFQNAALERNLAVLYSRQNEQRKVIEHLEKALQLDPKALDLRKYLISLLLKNGQKLDAAKALAIGLSQAPQDPQLLELKKQAGQ